MASDFRGHYFTGIDHTPLNLPYTPDTDSDFDAWDLVFLDTADNTIDECGADPAVILGWAQEEVRAGVPQANLRSDGKVLVEPIMPGVRYGLPVSGTLSEANVGKSYGIVKLASGNWAVDLSDTTNLRVIVVDVDVAKQIAFVHFYAANCQFSGVLS